MRALITRPVEDARPLSALLAARGVDFILEPLLEIVPRAAPIPDADLDSVQALLFTSANGVRAFAALSPRRDLPVRAVGDGTAQAALQAGFGKVESASGDVAALAALVREKCDPSKGALFHAAGSALAGDLKGSLEKAGFTVLRSQLYEARAAAAFSPEARMNLTLGAIDLMLFFSPRTARIFADLWRGAGMPSLARAVALCLSPAVAQDLRDLGWQRVEIAARPDQPALMAMIDAEIARRKASEDQPARAEPAMAEQAPRQVPVGAQIATSTQQGRARGGALAGFVAGGVAGVLVSLALVLGAPLWQQLAERYGLGFHMPEFFSRNDTLLRDVEALGQRLDGVEGRTAELAARTDLLSQTLAGQESGDSGNPSEAVAALEARLAKLEAESPAPPELLMEVQTQKERLGDLTARLDGLTALEGRLAALEGRMSAHDQMLAEIKAKPSGMTAEQQRATALVLAIGQLRGALADGRPFGPALAALAQLADAGTAHETLTPIIDALTPIAATGAPTLSQLQASLPAHAIAAAFEGEAAQAISGGAQQGWLRRLLHSFSSVVTVRPIGADVEGDTPMAHLARAEAKLGAGDLQAAVDELGALQGAAAKAAADWLEKAKARLQLEEAAVGLADLAASAFTSLAPAAPQAAPADGQ